jgi:hypothetical protein
MIEVLCGGFCVGFLGFLRFLIGFLGFCAGSSILQFLPRSRRISGFGAQFLPAWRQTGILQFLTSQHTFNILDINIVHDFIQVFFNFTVIG